MAKELPALGYLYNNVCNDVTCAGILWSDYGDCDGVRNVYGNDNVVIILVMVMIIVVVLVNQVMVMIMVIVPVEC